MSTAATSNLSTANYVDKKCAFTFTWAIGNWPVSFLPSLVKSPTFHTERLQDTNWHLKISSGIQLTLFYSIHRVIRTNRDPVDVVVEISFLDSDGSPVLSKTERRNFSSTYLTYEDLVLEEEFLLKRDRIIVNDTLTIRCRLWSADGKYLLVVPPSRCFAYTRLNIERRTIFWCIKDFSHIPIGEPGIQHGLPHIFKIGHCVITLNLKIVLISGRQQVLISILEDNLPARLYFDLSILDVDGEKCFCCSATKYDLSTVRLRDLSVILKDLLITCKETMLFNDELCLRCEFEIENGSA
ncbi:uncharacterized protein TNCV_979021 [Trichonephila clavipes]|nr:uncharacterized protein TNCV_979021 [Trichonephila clavipes]